MLYAISDTDSFIIIDITFNQEKPYGIESYILCGGTRKDEKNVHTLWKKWWTHSLDKKHGFEYIKNTKREFLGEWITITELEGIETIKLDDIKLQDMTFTELQHELFLKVVVKLELSGYKYVPIIPTILNI